MADDKAEKPKYLVTYKEIVELLLEKHNIHEGIWGIYVEFKFAGINAVDPMREILPASVSGVSKIGIIPFQQESNIAFDASKLNPAKPIKKTAKRG